MEKDLKGKGFIKEKKEGQGPKGKIAFLLPLSRDQNRGGGGGDGGADSRRARVRGGHGGGKGTRGSRAFDSPSYLELGRSEAAAPRGPVGGGHRRCGVGAVGRGGGQG